jgi:hypothetical protein
MQFVFDTPGTDLATGNRILAVRVAAADEQGARDWFERNLGQPIPAPRPMVPGEKIDLDLSD